MFKSSLLWLIGLGCILKNKTSNFLLHFNFGLGEVEKLCVKAILLAEEDTELFFMATSPVTWALGDMKQTSCVFSIS